ncbi:protein ALTERED PHOSPHATE STARVATION RESPONSE 1 [Cannabis sativa]|uniref:protein ALTERED PHOSPHATE STARVATION RESPONSE 1 n=1 Tax=Cannabis sativa TaxID=3483 RepID=UPI0029C9E9B6|nr:protein ALTERED PHOSPHATE STARVATION RESPONSE 1 [Cannabis sativa]
MGCANSKLNDLPAVALCRDRCKYLDEALRHSQDFAEAHAAYLDSLKALGPAFDRFFSTKVPVNNETLKKSSSLSPAAVASSSPLHKSNSADSHLRFPSDSSEDEDSDNHNKLGHNCLNEEESQGLISHNFNYLNSKPPPSPPPASLGSAWDFLNLFENFDKYERLYTSHPEKEKENGETTTYEVRVLETKKDSSEKANGSVTSKTPSSTVVVLGVPEAMNEIKLQFVQASESGSEVSKLLCHRLRVPLNQDSFRLVFEEDMGIISSPNLSSTLKKLLLWEKKLYFEVKAEEKLRTIYQKKYQQLKILDREGGKSVKANSTKALLRDLSTKLKIAFQIVDRISIAINKLREEELWPQIKELNNRLLPMWKAMIECHKRQYQAISEVKSLDGNAITSNERLNNADLEASIQLKIVLQTWNLSFSNWIFSQKDLISTINGWLMRCLLYEPEETSDGLIPFSPGRLGAPNIFVICNHWSQALDRISEKEVIGALQGCLACIDTQLKEHNVELLKMVISDKEIERKVKIFEREEQKMVKLIQGREKNLVTSFVLNHSDIIKCNDLQLGLKQIFMAMEKFMANSIQVYEELRLRIEQLSEYNAAAENLSGP